MSVGDSPTVLVVDDEPDVADAYASQLGERYHVETAYGGEAAIDRLTAATDVALLDRRMPRVSGDEVLDRVREAGHDVRVAMVTAVDPDFDVIEMPFDDYVTKPASRDELFEVVDRLLTCAEYEDRIRELYSLSRTYATLLASKRRTELDASPEFADLHRRRERAREELADTVEQFDDGDFTALFRDFDDGSGPTYEPPDE